MRVITSGPLKWIVTVRDAARQRISAGEQEVVGIFAARDLDRDFCLGGAFEELRAGETRGLCQGVDLIREGVGVGCVEAPEKGAAGGGAMDAERTIGRREVEAGGLQRRVGRLGREGAQRCGEAMQIFRFAEHQNHRVEVAGEERDAEHQTITSMTSVAWHSSSVPGAPLGTSIRRTFAHSSLTSSSTSAVMLPTRRSLLPTAMEESSIIEKASD